MILKYKIDKSVKYSQLCGEQYEKKEIQILQAINNMETIDKNRQFYHIKSSFKLANLVE